MNKVKNPIWYETFYNRHHQRAYYIVNMWFIHSFTSLESCTSFAKLGWPFVNRNTKQFLVGQASRQLNVSVFDDQEMRLKNQLHL